MKILEIVKKVSTELGELEQFADVPDFNKFMKNVRFYLLQNCKGFVKETDQIIIKQGDKLMNINTLSFFTVMVKASDSGCDLTKKEGYLVFRDSKSENEGVAIFTPHWEFEKKQYEMLNNCSINFLKIYTNKGDKFYKIGETDFEFHLEKKENFTESYSVHMKESKQGYKYKAVTTTLPTHYACIINADGKKYSLVDSVENLEAIHNTANSPFYKSANSADFMYYKAIFRKLKKIVPNNLQNSPDYEKITEYVDFEPIIEDKATVNIELTEKQEQIVTDFSEPAPAPEPISEPATAPKKNKEKLTKGSDLWIKVLNRIASGQKLTITQLKNHYEISQEVEEELVEILK